MRLRLGEQVSLGSLTLVIHLPLSVSHGTIPAATSKENAPLSRREADLPRGPALLERLIIPARAIWSGQWFDCEI